MTVHAYPLDTLIGDYGRAGAGLALVATPMATLDLGPVVAAFGSALLVLFGFFAARTAQRHVTRVEVSDEGIAASGPFGGAIPWERLEAVKLGYYATRRDGKDGWMQLALRGAGRRITMDSRIEGFDGIVRQVAREAQARGIPIGSTTAANFAALGLDFAAGPAQ